MPQLTHLIRVKTSDLCKEMSEVYGTKVLSKYTRMHSFSHLSEAPPERCPVAQGIDVGTDSLGGSLACP